MEVFSLPDNASGSECPSGTTLRTGEWLRRGQQANGAAARGRS
ncbi:MULTISPECIES: hypothetical protein [Actinomycetes]|nr:MULTISPECIES: hypothetical protein [Actinomycetes]